MMELEGRRVYSVSEIVGILTRELESAFPDIWVEGEVSNLKRAASGHVYFTLKDANAAIRAVLFRTYAQRLRFAPEAGMRVLARGKISVYGASGDLQLYTTFLEPSGLGALQMALEQAKRRLMAEGLTDPARKRPLPPFPGRVGVVTSLEGAAWRDVLSVLRRRGACFDLVIAPSPVQGAAAPASLVRALERLQRVRGIEVILLTRGGGSIEDLWAFNDEALARAVAASEVPVISAVGHEVDTVLTDLTADRRAATPSVAAELLTEQVETAFQSSVQARRRMDHLVRSRLLLLRERLDRASPERLKNLLVFRMDRLIERQDRIGERLEAWGPWALRSLGERLRACERTLSPAALSQWTRGLGQRLDTAARLLEKSLPERVRFEASRLEALMRLLHTLSPLGVLSRGYGAVFTGGGTLVTGPEQAPPGTTLSVALRNGGIRCRVEEGEAEGVPESLRSVALKKVIE